MTPAELNEKKLQFFKTVIESIRDLSDVASSNDLGELARLALEEEFCSKCGTHPADVGCAVCGRPHCDVCYPNVMEACSFCGEKGSAFLDQLYKEDERIHGG